MKIGFSLPQHGSQARQGAQVARFAAEIEKAGADSLWVGERLLAAVNPTIGYAGKDTIPDEFNAVLDPFLLLGVAAAVTERVRLGTNVLVAPLHRPAQLARSLTTLDVMSGGRLVPGFGIGWSPEEYEAAQVPFTHRGARLDETLDALEAIWTTDPASYEGTFVTVPAHRSELKPVQRPRPPIWLGAFNPAGLARIGQRGDGWLPVVPVPGPPGWGKQLLKLRALVDQAAEAAGRDPGAIGTIVRVNVAAGTDPALIADTIEQVAADTGFDDFFIDLMYVTDSVNGMFDTAAGLLDRLR
ncbi:TIGR03619 family F420-dependent LLM class oxidoreductase [Nocardia huaxiensis]|uniref:TIGR03619 family F420-dependent LLM class oxidoreductase n=1 Tax=Nocardia huaxiensis TaxID=2755382 RepID=A0A7D6Z8Z0_9NOCA|nr:TIGR03619 family F420-dependent LLM class oxidoreductase [Nocardia huaxiensis]QLY27958.1 TIGR03619 family F420-dependent LLM class oxidoreductase [Nocardia huaxiensis]UFS98630.1 TIGR03619 family F420-dependent LLM class oxidoreductase [Nocardia huaxiensis]